MAKKFWLIELAGNNGLPLYLREHVDGSRSWTPTWCTAQRFSSPEEGEAFARRHLATDCFRVQEWT